MCGCGDRAARMDERDSNHPLLKKALREKDSGQTERAIELLQQAIEERPDLARAHLELGLLYDIPNGDDFVRAIYHYQRYLEKRPTTEKRDIIEGLILGARLSYATTIPNQPSGAVELISKLKRENEALRRRIVAMESAGLGLPESASARADDASTSLESTRVQEERMDSAGGVRTYVVVKNDSLSRIAAKVYGDPGKWKDIYEANKSVLSSPESIKLGQKLVIPDL
jgi:nucleoid-associated protein YgaU